jgi:ribosomal protein S18 acetylase RimI-like enzyme
MQRESASKADPLEAHEFEPSRWRDFESLFRKYHGVSAGCWCMFYHRNGPTGPLESAARQEANRLDHRALLLKGHAHGILVYRGGRAVGWCQFGRRGDLPRIEHGRKYKVIARGLGEPARWRITCFFVDRPYRRSGVARTALHAALEAIRRRGGGVVEAYPATHGRAVAIWFGTTGMFEQEGFRVICPFGLSNVLVRRKLRPMPPRAARKSFSAA